MWEHLESESGDLKLQFLAEDLTKNIVKWEINARISIYSDYKFLFRKWYQK